MSSSLRRSKPAVVAAAAAANLRRPLVRQRFASSSSSSFAISQLRHVKHGAATATKIPQPRRVGNRGLIGGGEGQSGGPVAFDSARISGAGGLARSGMCTSGVLGGGTDTRNSATMATAPAATTALGGDVFSSQHQPRPPPHDAGGGSQNSTTPPLFFSSEASARATHPPTAPPPPTAAPLLSTTATATRTEARPPGEAAAATASHPPPGRPGGRSPFDYGAPSSSFPTFGMNEDGCGAGNGGVADGPGRRNNRRVFSSLPAGNAASSPKVRPRQQQPQPQPQPPPPPPAPSPRISAADEELLATLSVQEATPLSLRDIHAFCQSSSVASRVRQAKFLHREVPIRFAKRALELRHLPYGLSHTAPVLEAAEWYARIMRELVECPVPGGPGDDQQFADFLSSLLMDHTCVPQALSRGVLELQEKGEVGLIQRHRIDRILDNFFISRISLRFLVDTYISSKKNKPGFSGVIESECSPVLVAWRAAADVDRLCRLHMGASPAIEVFGRAKDTFTAVPSHLYYILREVLKNSCRATVEHMRRTRPGEKLPPVKIIVARGNEDMTIKIVDEGGGIRRSDLQRVWSYMYSTAPKPTASQLTGVPLDHMSGMRLKEEEAALNRATEPEPGETFAFAGYGMGLPLSRLYARYFGGSLKLRPMEGYGTDAYIHLHRLRTNSEELLPNSLEETLRVMADDGRVNVARSRSWKQPASNDDPARELIRSFGEGL
ncbi:unnamed protein product [Ectocarpus sp. CCAP 1310/34]|nr:unnamed protein product [Ectocarpus sp. CCAP 1310/34]